MIIGASRLLGLTEKQALSKEVVAEGAPAAKKTTGAVSDKLGGGLEKGAEHGAETTGAEAQKGDKFKGEPPPAGGRTGASADSQPPTKGGGRSK